MKSKEQKYKEAVERNIQFNIECRNERIKTAKELLELAEKPENKNSDHFLFQAKTLIDFINSKSADFSKFKMKLGIKKNDVSYDAVLKQFQETVSFEKIHQKNSKKKTNKKPHKNKK